MENIYLIMCETEFINKIDETVIHSVRTVYQANKTIEKAEENKEWYENHELKTNTDKYIKRRYFIQEIELD